MLNKEILEFGLKDGIFAFPTRGVSIKGGSVDSLKRFYAFYIPLRLSTTGKYEQFIRAVHLLHPVLFR